MCFKRSWSGSGSSGAARKAAYASSLIWAAVATSAYILSSARVLIVPSGTGPPVSGRDPLLEARVSSLSSSSALPSSWSGLCLDRLPCVEMEGAGPIDGRQGRVMGMGSTSILTINFW